MTSVSRPALLSFMFFAIILNSARGDASNYHIVACSCLLSSLKIAASQVFHICFVAKRQLLFLRSTAWACYFGCSCQENSYSCVCFSLSHVCHWKASPVSLTEISRYEQKPGVSVMFTCANHTGASQTADHLFWVDFVILEHKKIRVKFFKLRFMHYADLWCMVCYDRTMFEYLESEGAKKPNIEKIIFKVVKITFLAMHITNQ